MKDLRFAMSQHKRQTFGIDDFLFCEIFVQIRTLRVPNKEFTRNGTNLLSIIKDTTY